jgi:hypothetical protein
MRESDLRLVLLVKAVEEADREGTLVPRADRLAATREAARDAGGGPVAALGGEAGAVLPARAQRLLVRRAQNLYSRLVSRFPIIATVLRLAAGPGWLGAVLVGLSLLVGFSLSALDGSRRIQILSLPLFGLVLWNLVVYVAVLFGWWRGLVQRVPRRSLLSSWLAHTVVQRMQHLVGKAAAFNAPLAVALRQFVNDWYESARPLLTARAMRLFHLCAAAVALGLVAGLYLRGMVLSYQAGWESTFLDEHQVHTVLSLLYGPASWLTGIPIPGSEHLAAIRWQDARGGENAASWIHLLAATAMLYIVLPRLALSALVTLLAWLRSHSAPLPPALVPYFRSGFGAVDGAVGRGIIAVVPYAYEPPPSAAAALTRLLPAALGENLAVDLRATVRYGDEEAFVQGLPDRGGHIADAIALLFSLAATPEDENHGRALSGVRDWLSQSQRHAQLLVLVDERPYAERMAGQAGFTDRIAERRALWASFVAARGLRACFVDLSERQAAATDPREVERLRGALWQAVSP